MVKGVGGQYGRTSDRLDVAAASACAEAPRAERRPEVGTALALAAAGRRSDSSSGLAPRAQLPPPASLAGPMVAAAGPPPHEPVSPSTAPGPTAAASAAPGSGERHLMSAQRVFEFLSNTDEVRKGGLGRTSLSWISATEWKKESLAARLARYADYPQWRERIEPLAKAQGLVGPEESLPPPAKALDMYDAQRLVSDLSDRLERRRAGSRHGNAAKPLGFSKSSRRWVKADGTLCKPLARVAALPGYANARGAIERLLRELGHEATASELPMTSSGCRERIGADIIAAALVRLQADPHRSMQSIAQELGVVMSTLDVHVSRDGKLRDPERLRAMPDYATHAGTIEAALRALHPAAAEADRFMDKLDTRLSQFAIAARLAQADPSIDVAAAARDVGVSEKVARMVLDSRGVIRDGEDIRREMGGFDANRSSRLDQLLARLAARLDHDGPPRAPASGPPTADAAMKAVRLKGAWNTPDKVIVVDRDTSDPGLRSRGRLAAIYAQNPSLVHGPRSYEADRHRQPLRWLSTLLAKEFPAGLEVQCHYDRNTARINVSSNLTSVNAQIARFLAGGGLERLLSEGAAPLAPLPPEASRTDRHHAKLAQRLNPAADPHPTPLSDEVWGAIAERRFIVPRRSYAMDQGHTNLHAERRLADFARQSTGQDMDIDMLAGTMRPCGTCADAIEAPLETHRGPYWMSKASTAGRDVPADIQRSAREGVGTSITRTRGGRLTFEQDTDSDSDA